MSIRTNSPMAKYSKVCIVVKLDILKYKIYIKLYKIKIKFRKQIMYD